MINTLCFQALQRSLLGLMLFGLLWCGESHARGKDQGPAYFRKGTEALRKGQYYQATQLLQKSLKTLSHWGLAHLELARAMQFNGDPMKAIEGHLQKALTSLPRNPRAQLFAGQFYEAQGRAQKALPHYQKAVKLGHFAPTACLRASALLLSSNKGARAIPCLKKLLQRKPAPQETYRLLAKAHQQTGQWDAAARWWQQAVARQPDSLALLQTVFAFYQQHIDQQPAPIKRRWRRDRRQLQRKLRKLLPRKTYRRLRPLLPSKR